MPRPLTRKNADGEYYKRLSSIEDDIAHWEAVDSKVVASAACKLDYRAAGYIKNEVLFHLLRTAGKNERRDDYYALFPVMLARVKVLIRKRFAHRTSDLDALVEEICSDLTVLLAEDAADVTHDELDFFEVRFALALNFLVLDHFEENQRWYSRHQSNEDLVDGDEYVDVTKLDDSEELTGPERVAFAAQIERAFHALSDEERAIVELRYLQGMKTSAKDAGEETIPQRLNLSERTVRNRLTSAIKKLSKFKERQ